MKTRRKLLLSVMLIIVAMTSVEALRSEPAAVAPRDYTACVTEPDTDTCTSDTEGQPCGPNNKVCRTKVKSSRTQCVCEPD